MISRRPLLALPTLLAAPALAQSDTRPSITIAVQKITNSNTLEPLREQSNVGERVFYSSLWEGLIGRDWQGDLSARPGLATAWRRISDSVLELSLRPGVRFHNGDEMTAEDVAFSFGRARMFGDSLATAQGRTMPYGENIPAPRPGKELPPEVPAIARRAFPALERVEVVDRMTVRFHNATPDVTLEGRLSRYGLKGGLGDAVFAVPCGCGHNLRKILACLRAWLAQIIAAILALVWPSQDGQHSYATA